MYKKYLDLIKLTTNYSIKMDRLSKKIFGEVVRPTNESSMRVTKMFSRRPDHMDEYKVNYYPRHEETYWLMKHLRNYGLFRDEHQDFKEEMRRLRALRGKGIKKERKPKK